MVVLPIKICFFCEKWWFYHVLPMNMVLLAGVEPTKMVIWLVVWNIWTIFRNIWDNPSHWLIFFKMIKTTKPPTSDFPWFSCQKLRLKKGTLRRQNGSNRMFFRYGDSRWRQSSGFFDHPDLEMYISNLVILDYYWVIIGWFWVIIGWFWVIIGWFLQVIFLYL